MRTRTGEIVSLLALALVAAVFSSCGGSSDSSDSDNSEPENEQSEAEPSDGAPDDVQELAELVVGSDPHAPEDFDLFDTREGGKGYPGGAPMPNDAAPTWDEAQGEAELTALLAGLDADQREAGLDAYGDPDLVTLVPDPFLRVGFAYTVALHGGALLPADPPFNTVRQGGACSNCMASASGTMGYVIVNRTLSPPPEAMPGLLEHEGQHLDDRRGLPEEVILNAYTYARYFQALLAHPDLARQDDDGIRLSNQGLQMVLNSHAADDAELDLYATTPVGVAPGSLQEAPSFAEAGWGTGAERDVPSPMSPAFRDLIADELEGTTEVPADLEYGQEAADLFNQVLARWMTPVERLQVEVLLTLRTLDEVAELSGLDEDEAIETFGLEPFL